MLDNFNKIDYNKKLSLFRDGSSASQGFTDVAAPFPRFPRFPRFNRFTFDVQEGATLSVGQMQATQSVHAVLQAELQSGQGLADGVQGGLGIPLNSQQMRMIGSSARCYCCVPTSNPYLYICNHQPIENASCDKSGLNNIVCHSNSWPGTCYEAGARCFNESDVDVL